MSKYGLSLNKKKKSNNIKQHGKLHESQANPSIQIYRIRELI